MGQTDRSPVVGGSFALYGRERSQGQGFLDSKLSGLDIQTPSPSLSSPPCISLATGIQSTNQSIRLASPVGSYSP